MTMSVNFLRATGRGSRIRGCRLLLPGERTSAMIFSPSLQLEKLPLTKQKWPWLENWSIIFPSSKETIEFEMLQLLYSSALTRTTESTLKSRNEEYIKCFRNIFPMQEISTFFLKINLSKRKLSVLLTYDMLTRKTKREIFYLKNHKEFIMHTTIPHRGQVIERSLMFLKKTLDLVASKFNVENQAKCGPKYPMKERSVVGEAAQNKGGRYALNFQ